MGPLNGFLYHPMHSPSPPKKASSDSVHCTAVKLLGQTDPLKSTPLSCSFKKQDRSSLKLPQLTVHKAPVTQAPPCKKDSILEHEMSKHSSIPTLSEAISQVLSEAPVSTKPTDPSSEEDRLLDTTSFKIPSSPVIPEPRDEATSKHMDLLNRLYELIVHEDELICAFINRGELQLAYTTLEKLQSQVLSIAIETKKFSSEEHYFLSDLVCIVDRISKHYRAHLNQLLALIPASRTSF